MSDDWFGSNLVSPNLAKNDGAMVIIMKGKKIIIQLDPCIKDLPEVFCFYGVVIVQYR